MTAAAPLADIVRSAAAGDPIAAAELALILDGKTLTPADARRLRDHRLRRAAAWLARLMPQATSHAVAAMLAAAGRRVECGQGLRSATDFDGLTLAERIELQAIVEDALAIAPPAPTRDRTPSLRQTIRIIAGLS
jgi:hypothetical protein